MSPMFNGVKDKSGVTRGKRASEAKSRGDKTGFKFWKMRNRSHALENIKAVVSKGGKHLTDVTEYETAF